MTLTLIALLVLVLLMAQIFLQEVTRYGFRLGAIMGNRDARPAPTRLAARLDRAKNNLLEAMPFFVTLTALALVKQGDSGPAATGALVFLAARVLYVPAYASGVFGLRSVIWLVSVGGLVMMAWTLL